MIEHNSIFLSWMCKISLATFSENDDLLCGQGTSSNKHPLTAESVFLAVGIYPNSSPLLDHPLKLSGSQRSQVTAECNKFNQYKQKSNVNQSIKKRVSDRNRFWTLPCLGILSLPVTRPAEVTIPKHIWNTCVQLKRHTADFSLIQHRRFLSLQ